MRTRSSSSPPLKKVKVEHEPDGPHGPLKVKVEHEPDGPHGPLGCQFCFESCGRGRGADALVCKGCTTRWHRACTPLGEDGTCPQCRTDERVEVFEMPMVPKGQVVIMVEGEAGTLSIDRRDKTAKRKRDNARSIQRTQELARLGPLIHTAEQWVLIALMLALIADGQNRQDDKTLCLLVAFVAMRRLSVLRTQRRFGGPWELGNAESSTTDIMQNVMVRREESKRDVRVLQTVTDGFERRNREARELKDIIVFQENMDTITCLLDDDDDDDDDEDDEIFKAMVRRKLGDLLSASAKDQIEVLQMKMDAITGILDSELAPEATKAIAWGKLGDMLEKLGDLEFVSVEDQMEVLRMKYAAMKRILHSELTPETTKPSIKGQLRDLRSAMLELID